MSGLPAFAGVTTDPSPKYAGFEHHRKERSDLSESTNFSLALVADLTKIRSIRETSFQSKKYNQEIPDGRTNGRLSPV